MWTSHTKVTFIPYQTCFLTPCFGFTGKKVSRMRDNWLVWQWHIWLCFPTLINCSIATSQSFPWERCLPYSGHRAKVDVAWPLQKPLIEMVGMDGWVYICSHLIPYQQSTLVLTSCNFPKRNQTKCNHRCCPANRGIRSENAHMGGFGRQVQPNLFCGLGWRTFWSLERTISLNGKCPTTYYGFANVKTFSNTYCQNRQLFPEPRNHRTKTLISGVIKIVSRQQPCQSVDVKLVELGAVFLWALLLLGRTAERRWCNAGKW